MHLGACRMLRMLMRPFCRGIVPSGITGKPPPPECAGQGRRVTFGKTLIPLSHLASAADFDRPLVTPAALRQLSALALLVYQRKSVEGPDYATLARVHHPLRVVALTCDNTQHDFGLITQTVPADLLPPTADVFAIDLFRAKFPGSTALSAACKPRQEHLLDAATSLGTSTIE